MKKLFAALALLCLLAGCSTAPPRIGDEAPTLQDEQAEQTYRAVLAKYSAQQEVFDGFDTRFFAGATLQTPTFREARVRRRAAFQSLPEPKVEQLLAEERAEAAQVHEFFLAVHLNDFRYLDIDFKNSIWRLAMVTPAGEVTPSRVRRIGRADLEMRAYYPYTGMFWVGFSIEFPKVMPDGSPVIPPGTDKVVFRMASSLGQADLAVSAN